MIRLLPFIIAAIFISCEEESPRVASPLEDLNDQSFLLMTHIQNGQWNEFLQYCSPLLAQNEFRLKKGFYEIRAVLQGSLIPHPTDYLQGFPILINDTEKRIYNYSIPFDQQHAINIAPYTLTFEYDNQGYVHNIIFSDVFKELAINDELFPEKFPISRETFELSVDHVMEARYFMIPGQIPSQDSALSFDCENLLAMEQCHTDLEQIFNSLEKCTISSTERTPPIYVNDVEDFRAITFRTNDNTAHDHNFLLAVNGHHPDSVIVQEYIVHNLCLTYSFDFKSKQILINAIDSLFSHLSAQQRLKHNA